MWNQNIFTARSSRRQHATHWLVYAQVETAIQIGYSTRLLTQDMYLIRVPAEGAEKGEAGDWGVTKQLEDLQKVVKKAGGIDESPRVRKSTIQ